MKSNEEIKHAPNLLVERIGYDGGYGVIYAGRKPWASVIWSNGGEWEHVSVCPFKRSCVLSWEDMCRLKEMFFRDDEVVVQYHPAKSEYVNNMPNCLHLWRPLDERMPTPPSIMVGVKSGESKEEIQREIKDVLNYKPVIERENKCICCGEIVPEGRQVCTACERRDDYVV